MLKCLIRKYKSALFEVCCLLEESLLSRFATQIRIVETIACFSHFHAKRPSHSRSHITLEKPIKSFQCHELFGRKHNFCIVSYCSSLAKNTDMQKLVHSAQLSVLYFKNKVALKYRLEKYL